MEADGLPGEGTDKEKLKAGLRDLELNGHQELDVDPSMFYAFTRDWMRIDVGLMIQRPPIFVRMRDHDVNFLRDRAKLMNEYYCDQRQFTDEFLDVSKLNEDILSKNPYASRLNLDNYPTHKMKDPVTGEEMDYCGASK